VGRYNAKVEKIPLIKGNIIIRHKDKRIVLVKLDDGMDLTLPSLGKDRDAMGELDMRLSCSLLRENLVSTNATFFGRQHRHQSA